jgi:hypothetical protein
LWDVQRHLPILIYGLVDWVPIGFFAAFAWSNVRLAGAGWLMLFQAAILVALAGCVKWCVNARPRTFVWVALVLLASAALLVWGFAVALPLVDDGAGECGSDSALYVSGDYPDGASAGW